MKKKILLALSLIAIMTVLFAISVSAADPVETWDISNTASGDDVTASLYLNEDGTTHTLIMSGTGNMLDWDTVNGKYTPWWSYRKQITKVIVGEGIAELGGYSFSEFHNMAEIELPTTLKSVGGACFRQCYALTHVDLPDAVTTLSSYAFGDCKGLVSIKMPSELTKINNRVFGGCTKLKAITISAKVTSVGEYVFNACADLTVFCESSSKPSGWKSYWNVSVDNDDGRPTVVWNYKSLPSKIFTYKGYSTSEVDGQMAIGFNINYTALEQYELLIGEAFDMGVVFASYEQLNGQNPLNQYGNVVKLESGVVAKKSLLEYTYTYYDFILTNITGDYKEHSFVIAGYISTGEETKFVQKDGLADTVYGITYNEAKALEVAE